MKRFLLLIIVILAGLLYFYNRDQVDETVEEVKGRSEEIKVEASSRYQKVKGWVKRAADKL